MEEIKVERFVAMEIAVPKRRWIRSSLALYALLLLAVLGIITAGNALSVAWNLPRLFVQLSLYVILLAIGWFVYRYYLMTFRYTLTERMLAVDRVVGRKERGEAHVHLRDILAIRPYAGRDADAGKLRGLYMGKRADTLAVTVTIAGRRETLLLSPSEAFAGKLVAQWKTARK